MQETFDNFSAKFTASKALLDKKITELVKANKMNKVFLARCAQQTDQAQNHVKMSSLGGVMSAGELASVKESIEKNNEDMFYQFQAFQGEIQRKINKLTSSQGSINGNNDLRSDLRDFMTEMKSQRVNEQAKQSQESIVVQEKIQPDQLKVVFKNIDDLR